MEHRSPQHWNEPMKSQIYPLTIRLPKRSIDATLNANANVIKVSLMQNCQDLHNLFGVGKQKLKLKSNIFHCLLPIHECLG